MEEQKIAIVIDDDDFIRKLLDAIFTSLGYETRLYSSPLDIPCINNNDPDHCQNEPKVPDLLISDIQMPGLSGIDFIKQIQEKGCKIDKIAVVSGLGNEKLQEAKQQLGCKTFSKPFSTNDIKEWIEE